MSLIDNTTTTGSAAGNSLTAFFDQRDDAQAAVDRLQEDGIPAAQIRLVPGNDPTLADDATTHEHKGFLDALADFFMPEEDRYSYAEGLRRGGYLVTVTGLSGTLYDKALDILDDEGAVDFGEREQQWRTEGWSGYQAGTATMDTTDTLAGTATTSTPSAASGTLDTTARADSGVIPVVEEQLKVGKRDVNVGSVRVRSYVVETPVNEQVSLNSERVVVERRPVDRTLTAADVAFEDREIEAEEHTEEAVVGKTARVTEEIALRKETDQRQETVSDTVRHTEVEVEDNRDAAKRSTGTTGSAPRTGRT